MIDFQIDNGVGVVTLDRPPVNALSPELVDAFHAILDDLETDSGCGALLLRAATPRIFCAGADIRLIQRCMADDEGRDEMIRFVKSLQGLLHRLSESALPSVVALCGAATGGGLELAMACDVRVIGSGSRVGLTEARLGLIPGGGGTQRLVQLVGTGTATRMILTGELVDGTTAFERGIAQVRVEDDAVHLEAMELARNLSRMPPAAIRACKEAIALAPSPEGYEREVTATRELLEDPDTMSRVDDFLRSGQSG